MGSHHHHSNKSHGSKSHGAGHSGRLGDGTLQGEDFEPGLGHSVDTGLLFKILVTLLVLTIVTVVVSRIDFGHWNAVIAIVIATVKAGIVGTYFMHLKFEGKVILAYVAYPLVLLFLLIGGSFLDIGVRDRIAPFDGSPALPKVVIPSVGEHGQGHEAQHSGGSAAHSAGAAEAGHHE